MLTAPAAASQLIFDNVGIEERIKVVTAATAMKMAVHAPWLDTALSPIEMLKSAEPETNTQSIPTINVSTAAHAMAERLRLT